MEKKIVARIIIIVIFIALLVYVLLQYTNIFPEIYDPFSEKVRLVRNYACSLAICTRGCGDSMLSKRMCIERDPGTGGCKKWCQDICEENDWLDGKDGKHCGEDYQINLTLRSQVNLKGAYDIRASDPDPSTGLSESYDWITEILDIINFLNRTEHFTNLWDLLPFTSTPCTRRITDKYTAKSGQGSTWAWGFGLINWENAAFLVPGYGWISEISGGGDIILDSAEAHKLYNCFQKWPSTYNWDRATKRGYYSCEFTGSMRIWSFVDSYPEGCADVSLRAIEPPFAGDFVLWPDPDSRTIPLENQDSFKINITNSLGSDETFSLKTESINGIDCMFEGDGTLYVENTKTNGITMTCSPTQSPPSGYGSYIVVITAEGGGKTRVTKVNVVVTDFSIDVKPDYSREAGIGEPLDYTVEIENKLGKNAGFTVSILSPGVNCSFVKNDWGNVLDGENRTDTMSCKPTSGGTHDVTVTASYGPLEHNDTVEIVTPLCSVDSDGLKLKFFRGSSEVTNVNSGDEFTIQASGFSGCQNKFVDFYVNPGMHVSYWQVDPLVNTCKGNKFAGTPGTYKFYAVMVVDGIEYKTSDTTLMITKPSSVKKDNCGVCDAERCSYRHDKFCQHYVSFPNNWDACSDACDPQVCEQDAINRCSDYSNICCKSGDVNEYSSGPTSVPCLSPDTDITSGGAHKNNYILWRGGNLNGARNVLVKDDIASGGDSDESKLGYYAWFTQDYCNGDNGYCNGKKELTGFTGLQGGKCVSANNGYTGNKWFCNLSASLPLYSSWLYIKISDTKRPVYGIQIKAYGKAECHGFAEATTDPPQYDVKVGFFLHNSTGWFEIKSFDLYIEPITHVTKNIRPSGQFAWDDIDAILIVNEGAYVYCCGINPLDPCHWEDHEFYIDYVGLLTKGADIPYCTEGNTNDYYRTVNDGKNCYWGLDCPIENSEGWEWEPPKSTFIGPLSDVGCDCSGGSCGNGYCEKDRFCYYNVTCMNGGWNGNIDKCEVGETCKYDGCS
jgi:hypothetical protein